MEGSPQRDTNIQIGISLLLLNIGFLDFLTNFPFRQQKSESSKVKSKRGIRHSIVRMSTSADRFSDVPFT